MSRPFKRKLYESIFESFCHCDVGLAIDLPAACELLFTSFPYSFITYFFVDRGLEGEEDLRGGLGL